MATSTNELARLRAAKKGQGENPIKDGPNAVLDDKALELAEELAERYGMKKLRKLFPDMAALIEPK